MSLFGRWCEVVWRSRRFGAGIWKFAGAALAATTVLATAAAAADSTSVLDAGPVPRALAIASEFDAVRVSNHPDLQVDSSVTVELWVKRRPSAGCRSLVAKGRSRGYWFGLCDGRPAFSAGGVRVDGGQVVPEGRWAHVAVTMEGADARFYVDGRLDRAVFEPRLQPEPTDTDLTLGADAAPGSFLPGAIDHVRLWRSVRSEAEIAGSMLRSVSAQPGLVAQWALDGDLRDRVGGHDGHVSGAPTFTFDGALPRDLVIPSGSATVTMDGRCDPLEYGTAARVAVDSPDAPMAYLQSTDRDLYVCVSDMPRSFTSSGAAVLMDRDLGRDDLAQPGDYRLEIGQRSAARSDEGDGSGGWRRVELGASDWEIARVIDDDGWSAEFRVARSLAVQATEPGRLPEAGVAIANVSARGAGDDRLWPPGAALGSPVTWSTVSLLDGFDPRPSVTFRGEVRFTDPEVGTLGLAGARVELWTVVRPDALEDEEQSELELVDAMTTDSGGRYELVYRGPAPDGYLVREVDPRGVVSVSADAGIDGEGFGTGQLYYAADRLEREASRGLFVDAVGAPEPPALDRHYLIVYSDPVGEDDLRPFIEAKRRQGYRVRTMDLAELGRRVAGRDDADRIRSWFKAHWEAVEPEPVFALLVGRGDRLPVRDVGWSDVDQREAGDPDYLPAWPTDWYYADIDSEWDADGDGFHGEFLRCRPGEDYPVRDAEGEITEWRACPESGSLTREGPFGSLRGSGDDFVADIAVGRLAVESPAEVRSALAASLRAESSAGQHERRALSAAGFWWYEGESWSPELGRSVPGGASASDAWLRAPWDSARPFGRDGAELLENRLAALMDALGVFPSRLYESASPGGLPVLMPTRYSPDDPLSRIAVEDAWAGWGAGVANLAGNADARGLVTAHWLHDWDGDQRIDQPAAPGACADRAIVPLERIGPPCDELIVERVLDAGIAVPANSPPIVIANGGATGAIAWTWDGSDADGNVIGLRYGPAAVAGDMPARGGAAAWAGSMSSVEPGMLDQWQIDVNRALLDEGLRLGEAVWRASGSLAASRPYDMRAYGPMLYGDPAMAYWGSPLDAAGAWPQAGRDWGGTGASPYSGPAVPAAAWTTSSFMPASPPSIAGDGTLVLLGAAHALRTAPDGQTLASQDMRGRVSGLGPFAPALASDGVVAAAGNSLLVLDRDLAVREVIALPGGATAAGAPRLDPDGRVWIPTAQGMVRIDGAGRAVRVSVEAASGRAAFAPDGAAVWSTTTGRVEVFGPKADGSPERRTLVARAGVALSPPVVAPGGTIYAGGSDGRLYAWPKEDVPWSTSLGGPIELPPILSADGTVFVATSGGIVAALDAANGAEVWRKRLGADIDAPLALDGGQLYAVGDGEVHALARATGDRLWRLNLGGTTDFRSSPVIGADRALYVVRADRTLVAVREAGWFAPPSEVRATATGVLTVEWRDNSEGEVGFEVQLCDRDGRCETLGTAPAEADRFSAAVPEVEPGDPFRVRVRTMSTGERERSATADWVSDRMEQLAVELPAGPDQSGSRGSEYSISGWTWWPAEAPSAPERLRAEAESADGVVLAWDAAGDPAGSLGFDLSRARMDGPFQPIAWLGASARTYRDTDREPGTTYRYRVTAVGEGGRSAPAEAEATTKRIGLASPTDLIAMLAEGGRSVTLSWRDRARDEVGYVVERRDPGVASHRVVGRLATGATEFRDSAYIEDGGYHYRVRAIGERADSAWAQASINVVRRGQREDEVFLPFLIRPR